MSTPAGRDEGELHVNGVVIDGLVELIPDHASLPTYAGTFREKVNGVVTAFTEEGDVERVSHFRLRRPCRAQMAPPSSSGSPASSP